MSHPSSSTRMQLEHTDIYLNCHDELSCHGEYCTVHNRSEHSMRSFPQLWRNDKNIMERTCTHGVGHPDPDDFLIAIKPHLGVHGCDGCCQAIDN